MYLRHEFEGSEKASYNREYYQKHKQYWQEAYAKAKRKRAHKGPSAKSSSVRPVKETSDTLSSTDPRFKAPKKDITGGRYTKKAGHWGENGSQYRKKSGHYTDDEARINAGIAAARKRADEDNKRERREAIENTKTIVKEVAKRAIASGPKAIARAGKNVGNAIRKTETYKNARKKAEEYVKKAKSTKAYKVANSAAKKVKSTDAYKSAKKYQKQVRDAIVGSNAYSDIFGTSAKTIAAKAANTARKAKEEANKRSREAAKAAKKAKNKVSSYLDRFR